MTIKPPTPDPQDALLIQQLLSRAATERFIGQRMRKISGELLGKPYVSNPLIGTAEQPEVLVTTPDGFDCVTFVDSVLALALAREADEYPELLRELRYLHGEIAWHKRHHYTTDWMRHNIQCGFLQEITRGAETETRSRELSLIAGLPERIVTQRYFPKSKLKLLSQQLQDGDIISFLSTRKGLDVFHVGIIIRDGERILMRHAARSRGEVVEQELSEFVQENRTPGFVVARPRERQ